MNLKTKIFADETPLSPCLYHKTEFPLFTAAAATTAAGANRKQIYLIDRAMAIADIAFSMQKQSMLKSMLIKQKCFISLI